MLSPKKQKFRKVHKGRNFGKAYRGSSLNEGDWALQALDPVRLTQRQIEAARIAMTRHIKRGGKIWIRIFPDRLVTSKPAETRMGKGKGSPEGFVARIRPGRILYEMQGVTEAVAREAFRLAAHKLPVKTRVLQRSDALEV